MRTPGGEVAFIASMIIDSLVLYKSIRWYTCMIGKKSSISIIITLLQKCNIKSIKTIRFVQGKTMRWGIAWSFYNLNQKALFSIELSLSQLIKTEIPANSIGNNIIIQDNSIIVIVRRIYLRVIQSLEELKELRLKCNSFDDFEIQNISFINMTHTIKATLLSNESILLLELIVELKQENESSISTIHIQGNVSWTSNEEKGKEKSKEINRLIEHIKGDILRTNRRWRRLLAKNIK